MQCTCDSSPCDSSPYPARFCSTNQPSTLPISRTVYVFHSDRIDPEQLQQVIDTAKDALHDPASIADQGKRRVDATMKAVELGPGSAHRRNLPASPAARAEGSEMPNRKVGAGMTKWSSEPLVESVREAWFELHGTTAIGFTDGSEQEIDGLLLYKLDRTARTAGVKAQMRGDDGLRTDGLLNDRACVSEPDLIFFCDAPCQGHRLTLLALHRCLIVW